MTKYYLNYATHLGIHELSFHNSGYCCGNIIEFFEHILNGNDCNLSRYDLEDTLNLLEDSKFLEAIGMDEIIAEMLHNDIKEIVD